MLLIIESSIIHKFFAVLHFQKRYFFITALLLVVEVLIAMYMHDRFIRPYFGDVLIVILMYAFIKSFFKLPVLPTAIGVLLLAYIIEWLQYLNLIKFLGLQHSTLAPYILGSSFEWTDMLAYTAGIVMVICFENFGRLQTH